MYGANILPTGLQAHALKDILLAKQACTRQMIIREHAEQLVGLTGDPD